MEAPAKARPVPVRRKRSGYFQTRIVEGDSVTYRKHLFVLFTKVWLPNLILILLIALVVFSVNTLNNLTLAMLALGLMLIPALFWLYLYADWRNDIYRVTSDKRIDSEKKPLGTEITKSAPIENIQSMDYARKGIIGNLLNFGDVVINVGTDTKWGAAAVDPTVPGEHAADYVAAADRLWNAGYLPQIRQLTVHEFPPPRASDTAAGGLGGQQSVMARYRLAPDEALLITVRKSAARYQSIQLGDPWLMTPNFVDHQGSLNRAQAAVDADGYLRFVISLRDPGVANWLDPAGFAEGYVFMRWQGLAQPLQEGEGPAAQLVKLAELGSLLPPGTQRLSAAGRAEQLALRAGAPIRK